MLIAVNGVDIFCDIHGSALRPEGDRAVEKPVVIALHGGPGLDHTQFLPWLTPLADAAQLVLIDHRGNGRSSRPPVETCTLDAMAHDIEELRRTLGLGRVIVLGVSFGGMLALTYALAHPQAIEGLILCATAASRAFIESAREVARQRATPSQAQAVAHVLGGTFRDADHLREAFRELAPLYEYRPERTPAAPDRSIVNVEMLNWFFSTGVSNYDVRDRLHELTAPALILAGRHDWICPPDQSAELLARISGARQVMFEQSGHRLMREENAKFLDAVRSFIAELPSRRNADGRNDGGAGRPPAARMA